VSAITSTAGKERACEVLGGTEADEVDDSFAWNDSDSIEGDPTKPQEKAFTLEVRFRGDLCGCRVREILRARESLLAVNGERGFHVL
jgi:hypothetical protein